MLTEIQSKWLKHLLSTEPSDRPRAEGALRAFYPLILKLPAPRYFFWFDSPERAGWAVKLLESAKEDLWRAFVEHKSSRREGRLLIESLRAELCEGAGMDWDQLTQIAGRHRSQQSPFTEERIALHGLQDLFSQAWRRDHPPHNEYQTQLDSVFGGPPKGDGVFRVESRFQQAIHDHCGLLLSLSHNANNAHYTFAKMAQDEEAAQTRGVEVPPALAAAWDLAQSAGPCWVFEGAAVFLERPAELRFNTEMSLHCDDGPAGAFRDGTKIWAWNGMLSNEEYILHPEDIDPRRWKELAPEFVSRIKRRRAAAGKPEPPGKAPRKGSTGQAYAAILKSFGKRPAIQDRLAALREHNRGSLPMLDRYLAGEHEAVWRDMVALGAAVRDDPHAADALGVAYETMSRVESNVRTVSDRLTRSGFSTKGGGPLHTPPSPGVESQIRQLEKVAGAVPISLRAFYEIVGSVDWMVDETLFSPASRTLCGDPLVVLPIEAALEAVGEYSDGDNDEDEKWILIAPDVLHKADTSGGDPYQVEVPDRSADAILQFEDHGLYFVEYLRLVFRFGGFPGYEGVEHPPRQLAEFGAGLRPF